MDSHTCSLVATVSTVSAPGGVQTSRSEVNVRRLVSCTLPLYSFSSEDVMSVNSNKVVLVGARDSP